jgi:ABC-type multidrug transport system fused ATPase/permease subunit
MYAGIINSLRILDDEARRWLPLLFAVALLIAIFEAIGIGLILPLITVILDPDKVQPFLERATTFIDLGAIDRETFIGITGLAAATLFVCKSLGIILLSKWQYQVLYRCEARAAERLYNYYVGLPYEECAKRNPAELIRNINSSINHTIRSFITPGISVLTEGFTITAVLVMLIIVEPWASITALAIVFASALAFHWLFAPRLKQVGDGLQELLFALTRTVRDTFEANREIRVFEVQDQHRKMFSGYRRQFSDIGSSQAFMQQVPRYALEIIMIVAIAGGGFWLAMDRGIEETLSTLALFAMAGIRLMPPVSRIVAALQIMTVGVPAIEHISNDLFASDKDTERAAPPPPVTLLVASAPLISLRDVTFTYDGSVKPALHGVSFDIAKGDTVAFVGPSGSGKSSLVDLILGLVLPTSGHILINGMPLTQTKSDWLRRVGYVPQSIYLSDESIRQNVAFGVPEQDIDDARVDRALVQAHARTFVDALPEGTHTLIGDKGYRLSGGERQRIGIARALYREPEVVILDEATSALDMRTEGEVTAAINEISQNCTMLMIAHRIASIKHCAKLVFIQDGKVVAAGPYDELFASCKEFRAMIQESRDDTLIDVHAHGQPA